jgi:hypothetical protein
MNETCGDSRRSWRKKGHLFYLISVIFVFQGCDQKIPTGHFEGNIGRWLGPGFVTEPVGIDILYDHSKKSGVIEIKNQDNEITQIVQISNIKKHKFDIHINGILNKTVHLKKSGNCYLGESEYSTSFCMNKKSFLFSVSEKDGRDVFQLSADQFLIEKKVDFEDPKTFTFSEAVKTALNRNFDSRLEFERTIQAKQKVYASYLSLLPRFNFGTAAFNVTNSYSLSVPFVALASIGDFAPFLLPNRWLQAISGDYLGKSQKIALKLMQANLANQIEGLVYLYERDGKLVELSRGVLELLNSFKGTSIDQTGLSHLIQQEEIQLVKTETVLKTDRYVLSQSLGFHNPEAVLDITFNKEAPTIESAEYLESDALARLALNRSFELKQVDYMIKSSRYEKHQLWFSWIDPQTDPTKNLGFALIPLFKLESSKIRELQIQREQLQSVIVSKTYEAVAAYNEALVLYPKVKQLFEVASDGLNHLAQNAQKHEAVELDTLEKGIEQYVKQYVEFHSVLSSFKISRSKIDRLRLQGYYLELLPHREVIPRWLMH